jgi:hypothetical protein
MEHIKIGLFITLATCDLTVYQNYECAFHLISCLTIYHIFIYAYMISVQNDTRTILIVTILLEIAKL